MTGLASRSSPFRVKKEYLPGTYLRGYLEGITEGCHRAVGETDGGHRRREVDADECCTLPRAIPVTVTGFLKLDSRAFLSSWAGSTKRR